MFFLLISRFFKKLLYNPCIIENARLQLALIIPTGAPITVANDAIEMLPVATDKTMIYENSQKKQYTFKVYDSLVLFL